MNEEKRNLVDDTLEVHVITAGLSNDNRFMQLKVIALNAIKRAIAAEKLLDELKEALIRFDALFDLGEHIKSGEPMTFEDPSAINEAMDNLRYLTGIQEGE